MQYLYYDAFMSTIILCMMWKWKWKHVYNNMIAVYELNSIQIE